MSVKRKNNLNTAKQYEIKRKKIKRSRKKRSSWTSFRSPARHCYIAREEEITIRFWWAQPEPIRFKYARIFNEDEEVIEEKET